MKGKEWSKVRLKAAVVQCDYLLQWEKVVVHSIQAKVAEKDGWDRQNTIILFGAGFHKIFLILKLLVERNTMLSTFVTVVKFSL